MLRIFKLLNVVSLVKKVIKYGEHIKLLADTANYWHEQAKSRKLISDDTTVSELSK